MNKKKILLLVLYTLSLAAILYYPVSKIIKFEMSPDFEEFKFKATVYDPYDPMRGRYVQLQVQPDELNIGNKDKDFSYNEKGYAIIRKAPDGFARIVRLEKSRSQLKQGEFAVKVSKIDPVWNHKTNKAEKYKFVWPFSRFYLNELKAPQLEKELQKPNAAMTLRVKIFFDGSFAVAGLEKP